MRWKDVGFENNRIQASTANVSGYLKCTKTKSGKREVTLQPQAKEALFNQQAFTGAQNDIVFHDSLLHLQAEQSGGLNTVSMERKKTYSVGSYPAISLAAARTDLAEIKALLRECKDPVTQRRINRAESSSASENTFKAIATQWFTMKQPEWRAGHFARSVRAFERDVYPLLGKLPTASITPAMVAKAIEAIHKRDVLETATRILQHTNGIFRYAHTTGVNGLKNGYQFRN